MSDEQGVTPGVSVAEGGPHLVRGQIPLTTKMPILSEHGGSHKDAGFRG